jgi:hypothetical protein
LEQTFRCACCGEENEVWLDPGSGEVQELVQDCAVCCRPMVITARWNAMAGRYDLDVYQEDRD